MLHFKPLSGGRLLSAFFAEPIQWDYISKLGGDMNAAFHTIQLRSGGGIGFIFLTLLSVIIIFFLIALVEMVTLQLLRWGDARQALRASLSMNLLSSLV